MKKLELSNYGVQEMNAVEMREIDGGWKNPIGDWIFGKILDCLIPAAAEAYAQIIREGGTTSSMMPFP